LRELPAIQKIFEAVRSAVKIPFTVKFRAGWSESELVFRELAKMAEGCGLDAVAMHARTREQGYSGQAQWQWIAELKTLVTIPVIGNGDIRTPEDARAMVHQTGCDSVMIGRRRLRTRGSSGRLRSTRPRAGMMLRPAATVMR